MNNTVLVKLEGDQLDGNVLKVIAIESKFPRHPKTVMNLPSGKWFVVCQMNTPVDDMVENMRRSPYVIGHPWQAFVKPLIKQK